MAASMPREIGATPLWLRQWKPRIRCKPDRLGEAAIEPIRLGCSESCGPRVGLAWVFLIHIKDFGDLNPLPRLAVVGDEGAVFVRRRRGGTRVHSLAMIACSIKVVGASTGNLMSDQLPMETRSGGLVGDETGVDEPQVLWRSIDSQRIR
jgi:hypothetical protein